MPTTAYLSKLFQEDRRTAYRVVVDGLEKEFWIGEDFYQGIAITRPLRCGDIVCNETNPATGDPFKCGENYSATTSNSIQNVIEISPFSTDIDVSKRVPSFPVLEIDVFDPTGYVSGLTDMEEREVWVYHVLGMQDLSNDPEMLIFHGKIESWDQSESDLIWTMRVVSILHELNKKLGGLETYVTSDFDSGDLGNISVHDVQNFPTSGYVRIESRDYWPELAFYSSRGSATLNLSSRGIGSKTPYVTNGVDHFVNDVVVLCYYTGTGGLTIKDQIKNILTGTGAWGCGISTEWINQSSFDNFLPPWGSDESTTQFDCVFWEESKAVDILNTLLLYIGAFLYLDADSKIAIAPDSAVTSSTELIRDLDVRERPEIEDAETIVNKILIQNQINPDTQNWKTGKYTKKDQASIDKYGEKTLNLSLNFIKKPSTPNTAPKPGGDPPDPDDPPDFSSYVYFLANLYLLAFYSSPSKFIKAKTLIPSHLVTTSQQGVVGSLGLPAGIVVKKRVDFLEFETEFVFLRHGGDA